MERLLEKVDRMLIRSGIEKEPAFEDTDKPEPAPAHSSGTMPQDDSVTPLNPK